jgi:hypothetical protein
VREHHGEDARLYGRRLSILKAGNQALSQPYAPTVSNKQSTFAHLFISIDLLSFPFAHEQATKHKANLVTQPINTIRLGCLAILLFFMPQGLTLNTVRNTVLF